MPQVWFVRRGEIERGPLSSKELKRLVEKGTVVATDNVRTEEKPEWREAGLVKGLFPAESIAGRVPPPLPSPTIEQPQKSGALPTQSNAPEIPFMSQGIPRHKNGSNNDERIGSAMVGAVIGLILWLFYGYFFHTVLGGAFVGFFLAVIEQKSNDKTVSLYVSPLAFVCIVTLSTWFAIPASTGGQTRISDSSQDHRPSYQFQQSPSLHPSDERVLRKYQNAGASQETVDNVRQMLEHSRELDRKDRERWSR